MQNLVIDRQQATLWSRAYFAIYTVLMLLCWLLFFAPSQWSAASALILLALYVLSIRMWMAGPLFFTGMILFYFVERPSITEPIDPIALMFGGLLLLLVAFESAFKTCREFQATSLATDFAQAFRRVRLKRSANPENQAIKVEAATEADFPWVFGFVQQALRIVLALVIAAVAAGAVLNYFPVIGTLDGQSTRNTYALNSQGYRLIAISLAVFFVMAVLWLIANEIRRRTQSVPQSRTFLRNVMAAHLHADLRRIFLRRNRKRKVRSVKKVPIGISEVPESDNSVDGKSSSR